MTTTAHDSAHPPDPHSHGDGHEHPKFLAHHFETPQQQFDSGKLGIWLFLTTEILLFSGLFCAYAVYRRNHPEIYAYAHLYLNKWWGALNTLVLIFSSFTMAWAVTASQQGKKKLCVNLLGITILCGAAFMVVKYIEYKEKWDHYLLPPGPSGMGYHPDHPPEAHGAAAPRAGGQAGTEKHEEHAGHAPATAAADPVATALTAGPTTRHAPEGYVVEQSQVRRAALGSSGVNADWATRNDPRSVHSHPAEGEPVGPEPPNTHIFFSIYFLMTGLHGIHVLAGMALIGWVMKRAARGDFGPEYFTPVDFVGLYWHIVDLIWIFLFPLLYLIGNAG